MVIFGFGALDKQSVEKTVNNFVRAEKVGFDYGWLPDFAEMVSLYPVLAVIARETKQMKLGSAVTNPFTRHPLVTAGAIAAIDQFSRGRAVLGISSGDGAALLSIGIEMTKPVLTVKESVEIIRKALTGEEMSYEGEIFTVKEYQLTCIPEKPVPIFIGAKGPMMLNLAGKVADGVSIDVPHHLDVKPALQRVRNSARSAGRDEKAIMCSVTLPFSVDKDREKAKEPVKFRAAVMASCSSREILNRHEIDLEQISRIREKLSTGRTKGVSELASERILEAFALVGTPDYCIERISKLTKIGIDQVHLAVFNFSPDQEKLISGKIIPYFKN
jgi:5,10-methylenetetrahydromethanopterin reductase